MTVLVANTNVIELIGLKSAIDDTYVTDATVTVTISDYHTERNVGTAWPLTMDYVASSDGVYRAILADTLAFRPNVDYIAHIEASAGAGRIGHWELVFRPTARRS